MKVKIIRPTIALKRQVEPGDEIEVSKNEGAQLIGAGKAIALKAVHVETTDKPMAETETSVDVEPAPVEKEVKPTRGKSKKASE